MEALLLDTPSTGGSPAPHAVVQFGPYEIHEEIGRGGMATVDRAVLRRDEGFERQLVVKRILREYATNEQFVRMFINEARICALLDHQNIVRVYDFGAIEGIFFLAMEYLHGLTLADLLNSAGPIPPYAALYIAHQMCSALSYAQSLCRDGKPLQVIHRDISPSNIMISAQGEVKVLDFGIAKARDALGGERTNTDVLKGKVGYVSPEQALGKGVTSQSDIFSVGILLWEMLSGKRLFKGDSDFLTLTMVVQEPIPEISSVRPDVPPAVDAVCKRALARDPAERYQTPKQMVEHLEEALAGNFYSPTKLAKLVQPHMNSRIPRPPSDSAASLSYEISIEGMTGATKASCPSVVESTKRRFPRRRGSVILTALAVVLITVLAVGYHTLERDNAPKAEPAAHQALAPPRTSGTSAATPARKVLPPQVARGQDGPSAAAMRAPEALAGGAPPAAVPARAEARPRRRHRQVRHRSRRRRRRKNRASKSKTVPNLQAGALANPFD